MSGERSSCTIYTEAPGGRFGVVVRKGVMNMSVKLILGRLVRKDAYYHRIGEVVCRLHSLIVIIVQTLAFQVSVLASSWGGTLPKLVSENINIINVRISTN